LWRFAYLQYICIFLQLRKEELDRRNRQAEEEEIEKMKAIQREKVQPKKLFTSDFLKHFCWALCYSYASAKLHLVIWFMFGFSAFFMMPL